MSHDLDIDIDPDTVVLGMCKHPNGHTFRELQYAHRRVMEDNEGKRLRGIFRKNLPFRGKTARVRGPRLTITEKKIFDELYERYLGMIVARGDKLTYQKRFSALCNAKQQAMRGRKNSGSRMSQVGLRSHTVHRMRLYERFMMLRAKEKVDAAKRRKLCA